jgi:hypothetical protein
MPRHALSAETLTDLRWRLASVPARSPERRRRLQESAALYGVSAPTLYRRRHQRHRPQTVGRTDRGVPRVLPKAALERSLELSAAVKLRTANPQGRHLSSGEALRLLAE